MIIANKKIVEDIQITDKKKNPLSVIEVYKGGTRVWPSKSRPFSSLTWDEIHSIGNRIRTSKLSGDDLYTYISIVYGLNVGDTKTLTLTNGDTYTTRIIDFNDSTTDDGGKNGIRLEFVELYKDAAQMNSTDTNKGGFISSKMFTETLPSIFNLFPDEIKPYVRKTHIMRHGGKEDSSGETEFTADTELFLYSVFEVFGIATYANPEGVWLKYWKDHNTDADRIKYRLGQTSAGWWWLSFASRDDSYDFAAVSRDGDFGYTWADNSHGVGVCLSI